MVARRIFGCTTASIERERSAGRVDADARAGGRVPGGERGAAPSATIGGELKRWHKVTVTLDGPAASATGTPNPFLDLRMDVTFTHAASKTTYRVPGFFDADGNAANTGASAGSTWRAHLAPDQVGTWTYRISFRQGPGVAVADAATAGTRSGSLRRPQRLVHGRRDR